VVKKGGENANHAETKGLLIRAHGKRLLPLQDPSDAEKVSRERQNLTGDWVWLQEDSVQATGGMIKTTTEMKRRKSHTSK